MARRWVGHRWGGCDLWDSWEDMDIRAMGGFVAVPLVLLGWVRFVVPMALTLTALVSLVKASGCGFGRSVLRTGHK